jgi:4-azaleucine resistance transporter AzlC
VESRARPPYFARALAIGVGTGIYGISFGVLSVAAGLSVAKTCALSLLVFTGASQFAAIGVISVGGSIATALGNALLLGARNAGYGLSLARLIGRGPLLRRLLAAHLVIDETTIMARVQPDDDSARGAFWTTGVFVFVLWNLGTLVGAIAGSGLGDPARFGLDAAFPSAFLALLAPQLRGPRERAAAAIGVVIAVALLPFTAPGVPVLVAACAILPALAVRR